MSGASPVAAPATSSGGWLRAQLVWIVPFVGVFAAFLIQQAVERLCPRKKKARPENAGEEPSSSSLGGRTASHLSPFARTTFDLGGSLVNPSRVRLENVLGTKATLQGFVNLGIVLGAFQLLATSVTNVSRCGKVICDPFISFAFLDLKGPLVAFALWGLYFLLSTFLFVRLVVVKGLLPRRYELPLQVFFEASLFGGLILFIREQTHWALLQRLALGMEAFVLLAKQHSYIRRNQVLRADKEAGGTGEGELMALIRAKLASNSAIDSTGGIKSPASSPVVSSSAEAAPAVSRRPAGDEAKDTLPILRLRKPQNEDERLDSSAAASTSASNAEQDGLLINFWRTIRNKSLVDSIFTRRLQKLRGFGRAESADVADAAAAAASSSQSRPGASPRGLLPESSHRRHSYRTAEEEEDQAVAEETLRRDPGLTRKLFSAGLTRKASDDDTSAIDTPSETVAEKQEPLYRELDDENRTVVSFEPSSGKVVTLKPQAYPDNVNVKDFLLFCLYPVLTYSPCFFRSTTVRASYILEKLFLLAGLLLAAAALTEDHIRQILSTRALTTEDPFVLILRAAVPTTLLNILVFYISFEVIVNCVAEVTRFGSRAFYGPWWNATSFIQFSRDWNAPVNKWLLKEVYVESMRSIGLKPFQALFLTFGVSIVLHELIIWAALSPINSFPFLGVLSLLQFPLIPLMSREEFKGKLLGNLTFWCFLATGLSMSVVLYGRAYCSGTSKGGEPVCGAAA